MSADPPVFEAPPTTRITLSIVELRVLLILLTRARYGPEDLQLEGIAQAELVELLARLGDAWHSLRFPEHHRRGL